MGLLDKAFKVGKAAFDEAIKPESFDKGDDFEKYVNNKMFPVSDWKLIKKTQGYSSNKERFEDKSKEPDFQFQHIKSKKFVNVECKFRSSPFKGKIEWCKYYQLKRYKEIDNKYHNVYIVLGMGGFAKNPNKIYMFPVSEVKYSALYSNVVQKYEVSKNHKFKLEYGKLK